MAITIVDPNSETTEVTGLSPGEHTFRLTVTDSEGQSAYDEVTVTVNFGNVIVDAGNNKEITLPDNSVTLNGSASSPNGNITSYLWEMV